MLAFLRRLFGRPVSGRERLQIALLGAHSESLRLDAAHRDEIRYSILDWERRGGPAAWLSFVQFHRRPSLENL